MTDLEQASAALFERHRISAFGGEFHVPDLNRYPALFAWDSGYHALSMLHLDPSVAVRELTTLYRANLLPDGLLSHQRFVPGSADVQRFIEGLFGPMFDGDRTPFIDPPTAAYAAARVAQVVGAASADHLLGAALRHLQALGERRVLDGGVLPVALHPFETGTEGSVQMRPLLEGASDPSLHLKELTVSAVASDVSPERALAAGHAFVVYDPTMCGWYLLALEEVASACRARGRTADGMWAETTATVVADEIDSHLWWEAGHLFVAHDLVGRRQLPGVGAMGLVPAASRVFASRGRTVDVADHHVREGAPMWGAKGYAAGIVEAGAGVGSYVQWDGNAVWGATVYWAHLVALRAGRRDRARRLRSELEALVRAHGFREFYDAWSGEPGGAGAESGFTWPALVLEMASNEWRREELSG